MSSSQITQDLQVNLPQSSSSYVAAQPNTIQLHAPDLRVHMIAGPGSITQAHTQPIASGARNGAASQVPQFREHLRSASECVGQTDDAGLHAPWGRIRARALPAQ